MDWGSLPTTRVEEIVRAANTFAAQHPTPDGATTEWIGSRPVEERAVLRAVHDLQVNGPGVVTTAKAGLMAAEPSLALFELLKMYERAMKDWD